MRSSAPVATSQTSHGGSMASRRPASTLSTPSPEALSSAPGLGGTVSACDITTRRQSPDPARLPITLRERPCDVENRCTVTSRPAPANVSRSRRCARRSRMLPAGRGPAPEISVATAFACAPGDASARATAAATSKSESAAPREHGGDGLQQDRQVEAHRPALEVEEVQPHEVVEVELRPAGDLPQAGDAGQHEIALLVPLLELLEVALGQRSRTDERHLAAQHVEELRQLVE